MFSENSPDIWLLIPAFNVGRYLGDVINRVKEYIPLGKIVVVNDGSKDNTVQVAQSKGVILLSNDTNQGKGFALRLGFDYIFKQDAEWVITIDGDLQHNPDCLPDFIARAEQDREDLVIGERRREAGNMPWDRRFSNWSTSLLLSIITGKKIHDAQCGYRLIRVSLLRKLNLHSRYYDLETECLLKLIRGGARLGWIPIPTTYNDASSNIRRVKDISRFLWVVLKSL